MSASMKSRQTARTATRKKRKAASTSTRSPHGPARLADHVSPRLKGWLTWDDDFFLGPRYVRLLEEIDRTGTIRDACPGTGMSYRTCLNRIRQMERVLGEPLLTIRRGGATHGSAQLT
ncbi:MAG TPA: hypothetical protein VIC55_01220, partial [Gemmatimonadaceae bacterium]